MENKTLRFSDNFTDDASIARNVCVFSDTVVGHHRAHNHDFIEIAYIASGEGIQTVNGREVPIKEGDLYLFNAFSIVHSFDAAEGRPLLVYNCLFRPLAVDSSLPENGDFVSVAYKYLFHSLENAQIPKDYLRITSLKRSEVEFLLFEMEREYRERSDGYRQILNADLLKLLILIFRRYKNDLSQPQDTELYKRLTAKNALAYMSAHFAEDIKCEEIASSVYLSANYFRRIFKEVIGESFMESLQRIRIEAACAMLENTDKTVAEIAAVTGYADIKFFYELFVRRMGTTPGEYRKARSASFKP